MSLKHQQSKRAGKRKHNFKQFFQGATAWCNFRESWPSVTKDIQRNICIFTQNYAACFRFSLIFFSELIELIKEHNDSFPNLEDLQGCALAILRIQDVYRISAERIANGKLSAKTLSPEMGATHCLELGLMKHNWEQYKDAYGWLAEAWKRLSPLDKSSGITTKDVLQYLIWAEYKVRELEKTKISTPFYSLQAKGKLSRRRLWGSFHKMTLFPVLIH